MLCCSVLTVLSFQDLKVDAGEGEEQSSDVNELGQNISVDTEESHPAEVCTD